jgi:Amt family ammonium transporter
MGAIVIGFVAGFACLWGVTGLKKMLGADDSLDVFGVHGVGGIVGALLTGVFNNQALGGPGLVGDWVTASVSSGGYRRAVLDPTQGGADHDRLVRRRLPRRLQAGRHDDRPARREEDEREGLDITSHGETAYHN